MRRSLVGTTRIIVAFVVVLAAVRCSFAADIETVIARDSGSALSGAAEVNLPVTRCGDYFIAAALLNGRGPFRLLLDTGYPRTQLSSGVAEAIGVRRTLDSIDVGDLRVRGRIRVGVRDLAAIGYALGAEIDGVLGYTVFDGLLLTYDIAGGTVRVREGTLSDDAPGVIPMSTGERPFIRARLGPDTLDLVLDTGFSGGVALADFAGLAFREPPRPVGATVRVSGTRLRLGGRLVDDIAFDAFTLRRPVVTLATGGRNLLGQDVLRRFVVTLDRTGGRAQFLPRDTIPGSIIDLPSIRGTGLVLVPRADHLHVARVLEASPAQEAGILAGDRIVAVDSVSIATLGCPVPEGEDAGGEAVLTVERDGARRDVVVTRAVLVR